MSDEQIGRRRAPVTWDPVVSMKAILWEEAKGKLRALVALQGSFFSDELIHEARSPEGKRYDRLKEDVDLFIAGVEEEGLCE